jgi:hypothetical protein
LILIAIALVAIGLLPFQKSTSTGNKMELSDPDSPDYKIILSNIPKGVSPKLLKIEDRESLREYNKDGVGEILSIAGNLVFYDDNIKDKLVTSFASPVRLTFNYTEEDKKNLAARKAALIKQGFLRETEDVELIPAYLYSYADGPINNIWKPFQNFRIDKANQTMTIEFLFWGDQPIGPSTKP